MYVYIKFDIKMLSLYWEVSREKRGKKNGECVRWLVLWYQYDRNYIQFFEVL